MTGQPHLFYLNQLKWNLFEIGYELGDRQCVATHETREGAHELALAMFGVEPVVETPPLMGVLDVGRAGVPDQGESSATSRAGAPLLVAHEGPASSRSPSVRTKVVA